MQLVWTNREYTYTQLSTYDVYILVIVFHDKTMILNGKVYMCHILTVLSEPITFPANLHLTSPCVVIIMQCSGDDFRLLKYDITGSTHGLGPGRDSLLVHRHNAAPGMFMVSWG